MMKERYRHCQGHFPWEQIFQMKKIHLAEIFESRSLFFLRLHFSPVIWHMMNRQKVISAGLGKGFLSHILYSLCPKLANFCSDMQIMNRFFNVVTFLFSEKLLFQITSFENKKKMQHSFKETFTQQHGSLKFAAGIYYHLYF